MTTLLLSNAYITTYMVCDCDIRTNAPAGFVDNINGWRTLRFAKKFNKIKNEENENIRF
jgi:hypothetical protein